MKGLLTSVSHITSLIIRIILPDEEEAKRMIDQCAVGYEDYNL